MYLESQDLRLDEGERLAVDFDEASSLFAVGDCGGSLFLAEALDALGGRHVGGYLVEVGRGSVCDNVVGLRSDLARNLLCAAKSSSDAR